MMPDTKPRRAKRCGLCYWVLYDGETCQNKDCELWGSNPEPNTIRLTNDEARCLIDAVTEGKLKRSET